MTMSGLKIRFAMIALLACAVSAQCKPSHRASLLLTGNALIDYEVNDDLEYGADMRVWWNIYGSERLFAYSRPISIHSVYIDGERHYSLNALPVVWTALTMFPHFFEIYSYPFAGPSFLPGSTLGTLPTLAYLPVSLTNFGLAVRAPATDVYLSVEVKTDFFFSSSQWARSDVGTSLSYLPSRMPKANAIGASLGCYRDLFDFRRHWYLDFRLFSAI